MKYIYIFISYQWRRIRRAAHDILTKVVVRDYHPIFCKKAVLLASAILKSPEELVKHIQRSSSSATMSNYPTLENEHDEVITQINAFIDRMSVTSVPGAYLVELLPWMIDILERWGYILFIILSDHLERGLY